MAVSLRCVLSACADRRQVVRYGLYGLSELLADKRLRNLTLEAMDAFDCGHGAYDVMAYLCERAAEDDLVGRCRTYLVVDLDRIFARDPKVEILAYFTITQHRLDISELMRDASMAEVGAYLLGDDMTGAKTATGYLIVQFAKDERRHPGKAKGFLQFAQTTIERASELVGGTYILLDCGAERLRDYYRDSGFECIGEREDEAGGRIFQMIKLINRGIAFGLSDENQ